MQHLHRAQILILHMTNNFVTKCLLTMALQHNFFFTSLHIFNPHAMLINAYTKEFTVTNNSFLNYVIAFEYLQYYKMVANVY